MNIASKAIKAKTYILRFIQLQLFLTLLSLPILIAWGLPFSLLSPVGNLLFNPILTLFLLLCSLIFFTELICIPNGWLIKSLEFLTSSWLRTMHADQRTWLIGFAQPQFLILILIAVITIGILAHQKTRGVYRSIFLLSLLFIATSFYLRYATIPHYVRKTVVCNKGAITYFLVNNKLVVIDPGYMGQRLSAPSWVQYTLIPHIIQNTSKTSIDFLILLQPGFCTFQAAQVLATKMQVKNLYVPCWQGAMSPSTLRQYGALLHTAQEGGTAIVRLGTKPLTLFFDAANKLTLTTTESLISQAPISYAAYKAEAFIDNQNVTLYSAKYINKNHAHSRQQNKL